MAALSPQELIAQVRAVLDDNNLVITRANDASYPYLDKDLDEVMELIASKVAIKVIEAERT